MFKTTLLAAATFIVVSTQAQADVSLCVSMSEAIGSLAELRDSGFTAGQSFRAMLEGGLDADMASELLNLVYIEAKNLDPQELEDASLAFCLQDLT